MWLVLGSQWPNETFYSQRFRCQSRRDLDDCAAIEFSNIKKSVVRKRQANRRTQPRSISFSGEANCEGCDLSSWRYLAYLIIAGVSNKQGPISGDNDGAGSVEKCIQAFPIRITWATSASYR